jgi:hypothetical protein
MRFRTRQLRAGHDRFSGWKQAGTVASLNVRYIDFDEPDMHSPIIMSYRKNDRSKPLMQLIKQIAEITSTDQENASGD